MRKVENKTKCEKGLDGSNKVKVFILYIYIGLVVLYLSFCLKM